MVLKIATPLDCLMKQAEKNDKIKNIIDSISTLLLDNFELGKSCSITIESEELNWNEQYIIKTLMKKLGWRVSIAKKNESYTFIISEE